MLDIEQRVKEVIASQLDVPEEFVKPSAILVKDLGADSLSMVELVMALEDEFQIQLPDEQAADITTVGQAIERVIALVKPLSVE